MNDKTALEKLKDSVRQEVRQERTRGEDEARYEAANAVLVKAMKTGGGFADALTEFMTRAEDNLCPQAAAGPEAAPLQPG